MAFLRNTARVCGLSTLALIAGLAQAPAKAQANALQELTRQMIGSSFENSNSLTTIPGSPSLVDGGSESSGRVVGDLVDQEIRRRPVTTKPVATKNGPQTVQLLVPVRTGLEFAQIERLIPGVKILEMNGGVFVLVSETPQALPAYQKGRALQAKLGVPFQLAYSDGHPDLNLAWMSGVNHGVASVPKPMATEIPVAVKPAAAPEPGGAKDLGLLVAQAPWINRSEPPTQPLSENQPSKPPVEILAKPEPVAAAALNAVPIGASTGSAVETFREPERIALAAFSSNTPAAQGPSAVSTTAEAVASRDFAPALKTEPVVSTAPQSSLSDPLALSSVQPLNENQPKKPPVEISAKPEPVAAAALNAEPIGASTASAVETFREPEPIAVVASSSNSPTAQGPSAVSTTAEVVASRDLAPALKTEPVVATAPQSSLSDTLALSSVQPLNENQPNKPPVEISAKPEPVAAAALNAEPIAASTGSALETIREPERIAVAAFSSNSPAAQGPSAVSTTAEAVASRDFAPAFKTEPVVATAPQSSLSDTLAELRAMRSAQTSDAVAASIPPQQMSPAVVQAVPASRPASFVRAVAIRPTSFAEVPLVSSRFMSVNQDLAYVYVKVRTDSDVAAVNRVAPVAVVHDRDGQLLARVGVYSNTRLGQRLRDQQLQKLQQSGYEVELVAGGSLRSSANQA